MIAITPNLTPEIDRFAAEALAIPTRELMARAGEAVARAIAARVPCGRVLLFCGKGNNGGDGYVAARVLNELGYAAMAVDVFGVPMRTAEASEARERYCESVGQPLTPAEARTAAAEACCLVDAVFGTGARGELPPEARAVAALFAESEAYKVAVDLPLGADAASGCVAAEAIAVDLTVSLCYPKVGLYAYPAREACGEMVNADLGLDRERIEKTFSLSDVLLVAEEVGRYFPPRAANTSKGNYGRLGLLCGSAVYRGAAVLSAMAGARLGAGYVTVYSEGAVLDAVLAALPEAIGVPTAAWERAEAREVIEATARASALVCGCGCGCSEGLYRLLAALLASEGAPLLLDADAINALALHREEALALLREVKRKVLLTPHPLEFARLAGISVDEVQADRLRQARRFAAAYPVTLVLKGAGTVIAEGDRFAINTTGSPALSKGGSGDVLAGAIGALLAQGFAAFDAACAGVCLHGLAADRLAAVLSVYGVLPQELPRAMAEAIAEARCECRKEGR